MVGAYLTNERYIGNALFQKTITTNTLPFRKIPNTLQDKYLLTDTHESIISREMFEKVQLLIKQRKHSATIRNSIFNSKIFCGMCGTLFKFKDCGDTHYWVCRKHDTHADSCLSERLPEANLENAFMRLFNKLLSQYKNLFEPIRTSLQELEIKQAVGNTNVIEIRRNILQLKEQLRVIAELRTKGFLNEAKFNEQTAEINVRINKLNKDLQLISQSSDDMLKDIEMLIDYFEKRDNIMVDFEVEAFEFLVDKIIVNGNTLEFHIMGGLKFTEKI